MIRSIKQYKVLFKKACIYFLLLLSLFAFHPLRNIAGEYTIGPGDVLSITVWKQNDLNKKVTVAPDGSINFPLLGTLTASGQTPAQLEAKITKLLTDGYLKHPQVDVIVEKYKSQNVYVLGEVNAPGLYSLTGETKLLDIISMAGGMSLDSGREVYILKASAEKLESGQEIPQIMQESDPLQIDLDELLLKGNLSNNITVHAGDIIYFTSNKLNSAQKKIYITGEIQKPGAYPYQKGLSLYNACIIAGGFTEDAAPNRATVTRHCSKTKVIKINIKDIKKAKSEDFPLQPGDRIWIPKSYW